MKGRVGASDAAFLSLAISGIGQVSNETRKVQVFLELFQNCSFEVYRYFSICYMNFLPWNRDGILCFECFHL
jgi:hypothetical protein